MSYQNDAAARAMARRFTGAAPSAFAVLDGAERVAACRVGYCRVRRFDTPGEARAAETGFAHYPLYANPLDCPAYMRGWFDAEKVAQEREDARRERAAARRAE